MAKHALYSGCWSPLVVPLKIPKNGPFLDRKFNSLSTKDNRFVPCGKCPYCRATRASQWSFRLQQEWKVSHCSSFITLTYDEYYAPVSDNGFLTLSKSHVQSFFKRLRDSNCSCARSVWRQKFDKSRASEKVYCQIKKGNKAPPCTCPKIRYYTVGEYGTNTHRPHYHIILFNAQLSAVQKAWHLGQVHSGTVTRQSIGYTLKYISKDAAVPEWGNPFDDRKHQFSLVSKGIGESYLTPRQIKFHRADLYNRLYVRHIEGYKVSIPRYYKDRIYTATERKLIEIYYQGEAERMVQEAYDSYGSYYPPNIHSQRESVLRKQNKPVIQLL